MGKFPDDHPVPLARGFDKPSWHKCEKELIARIAWLENKYQRTAARHGPQGPHQNPFLRELLAWCRLADMLAERNKQ